VGKEIRWSEEAELTYERVLEYLQAKWTQREINNFIHQTEEVLEYISQSPKMFRKTNRKNVHEALVTPHNLLAYKIYTRHITLIAFWDTRKNPKRKKF
jgi:plasmid stabilization system protein ParE